MKKYIYLIIMAFIVVSCSETDELQNYSTDASSTLSAKITKTESRAVWYAEPLSWDGSDMANSRTYAKPEGLGNNYYHQYWSKGDKISYFNTTFNSMYVSTKADESTDEYTTYFEQVSTGEGETLDSVFYYGVYPYKEDTKIATDGTVTFTFPEEQIYCEDSYANGFNGMIARHESENEILEFLNFCSYLQLKLTSNVNKDIDKIVLKANNEQDFMSGVSTIAFNKEGFPVVTMDHEKSNNHLVLNCRDKEIRLDSINATNFWFVLPGGFTFTEGFNITVSFTDGTYFKKSTNSSVGIITIERNHIQPLATLPLDKKNLLTSMIRYKYHTENAPAGDEPFEFLKGVSFFKDEDGHPLTPIPFYNRTTGEYEITFNGHLYSIESNTFVNPNKQNLDIESIVIENSTPIVLQDQAFWQCTADTITINNDIINIGKHAFGIGNTKYITINGDIHSIETQAFNGTTKLETVKINGTIEHIENQGFSGSSANTIFVLERVTNIGEQAFYLCSNLVNVELPYVEHIEREAFMNCYGLQTIDLHGVHKIGYHAFAYCFALSKVCISKDCVEISEGAFIGTNIKDVYLYASTPPTIIREKTQQDNSFVFELTTIIHIPEGSLDAYLEVDEWRYYYENGYLEADITAEQINEHFGENTNESHNE